MTLTLEVNEFGRLATSGTLDDAVREPDFMKRANRLFDLREKVWNAYENTRAEITEEAKKEARAKARRPGLIGAFLGAVAGAVGALLLAGSIITPIALGFAAVGAAVLGFTGHTVAHRIWERIPEKEADEAQKLLEFGRKNMSDRIELEIGRMDHALFSQAPAVRNEFREAFRHAATKQETREQREHRAKAEAEAEQAACKSRAPAVAVALASTAALTTALAGMSMMSPRK